MRDNNTANAAPFVTKFTVSGDGSHTVEYRSRDKAGNTQDPAGSVTFAIDLGTAGGGSCLPQSDEFNGTALDPKWTVTRSAGGGPVVSDGALKLPLLQGDFIANDALASNTVLETAPDGEWTATAKVDTTALDTNGEQAGIVVWKSENPNTFSKVMAIRSTQGNYQFEHIVTQSGVGQPADLVLDHARPERHAAGRGAGARPFQRDEHRRRVLDRQRRELDQDRQRRAFGAVHRCAEDRSGRLPRRLGRRHRLVRLLPRDVGLRPGHAGRMLVGLLAAVGSVQRHGASTRSGSSSTRSPATPPTVGNGHLTMPMLRGDLYERPRHRADAGAGRAGGLVGRDRQGRARQRSTPTARRPVWR